MIDRLEQMLAAQDEMAARFIDIDKFARKEMPNADVQDWSLRYLDCVIEEVVEMKREYPRRKFWKRGNVSQPHDEAKALEEFADILHFLCAVTRINGWTSEEVFKAYMDKYRKNQERFASTRDENRG